MKFYFAGSFELGLQEEITKRISKKEDFGFLFTFYDIPAKRIQSILDSRKPQVKKKKKKSKKKKGKK